MEVSRVSGNKLTARIRWGIWLLVLLSLGSLRAWAADTVGVTIDGVDRALADNVEAHIRQLAIPDLAQARRQKALILRSARKGMEALGYYDAHFDLSVPAPGDGGEIHLQIRPGQPVRWQKSKVAISGPGAQDPVFTKLLARYEPHAGDVLNQGVYEQLKKQLHIAALSNGYFDASFVRHRLLLDRERHLADLDLAFDTGVRYRFGDVTFTTPTRLRSKVLERLIPFQPGDYYQESLLTQFNRNLLDTGYFQSVSLHPTHIKPDGANSARVPVTVALTENKDNRVSVGLGYGTDTGPRLRLTWLKPLINSHGHSLELDSSVSDIRKEASADYKIPGKTPGTDFWLLQAGYLEEQFEDSRYRQITYGISHQEQVWGDWTRTYFTKIKQEYGSISTGTVQTDRPSDAFYLTPGISFSQTKTVGGIRPVRGHKLEVDLEFSDPTIGSDTQYVRLSGLAKYLVPLSERQQLLMRLQLGMLWSHDFSQVPVSARFYAGGDQSIRGYDYNTLAPRDADGALVGGSRLAVGSVEYLYRFLQNWQAAVFVDHGGALNNDNKPVDTGAGVGIRWLSPVGVISVDVAKAVTGNGHYRFHVTMGTVL